MLRVALVEDSHEVQVALCALLGLIDGVEVVGAAADLPGAKRLIGDTLPDLVVLDVALLGRDHGIDVLHHVVAHHPRTEVIVLSNHHWPDVRDRFLAAGACAYFDKALQFRRACDWIRERAGRPEGSGPPDAPPVKRG